MARPCTVLIYMDEVHVFIEVAPVLEELVGGRHAYQKLAFVKKKYFFLTYVLLSI
jgi:hypothetical protein